MERRRERDEKEFICYTHVQTPHEEYNRVQKTLTNIKQ